MVSLAKALRCKSPHRRGDVAVKAFQLERSSETASWRGLGLPAASQRAGGGIAHREICQRTARQKRRNRWDGPPWEGKTSPGKEGRRKRPGPPTTSSRTRQRKRDFLKGRLTQDPMLGNSLVWMLFQDSHSDWTADGKFWIRTGPAQRENKTPISQESWENSGAPPAANASPNGPPEDKKGHQQLGDREVSKDPKMFSSTQLCTVGIRGGIQWKSQVGLPAGPGSMPSYLGMFLRTGACAEGVRTSKADAWKAGCKHGRDVCACEASWHPRTGGNKM